MDQNKDFEQVGIVAACILGALAVLLALPVLILCGFFAYMHWGLSISKPRNMLMKAFLLGVLGYFMTIIVCSLPISSILFSSPFLGSCFRPRNVFLRVFRLTKIPLVWGRREGLASLHPRLSSSRITLPELAPRSVVL